MDRPLITPQMRAWADQSIARIGQLEQPLHRSARRRVAVMHLDGVPRTVLEHAIETDRMPFLSRLVKTGAFHVDGAFWGSPASTPCFQAGLLYGLRHPNLPAYHWYDRELGQVIRMNVPRQALSIEERMGRMGHGSLLEGGGTAYLSEALRDLPAPHAANDNPVLVQNHMAYLGRELFSVHIVAVEIAGTLLLIALVGAIAIVIQGRDPVIRRREPPAEGGERGEQSNRAGARRLQSVGDNGRE